MHRLAGLTLVLSALAAATVACSRDDVRRRDGSGAPPSTHDVPASQAPASAAPVAPAIAAETTLARFLEQSREGHAGPSAVADSLRGCQMADGMYSPIEMLADFRILVSRAAGDTIVSLVEVVTVAREEGDPRSPDRFRATQRLAEDTVEFRLTRSATDRGWVVCDGPQYGFWGADATTTWDPPGASRRTARALADSVLRARRPSSSPAAR